MTTPAPIQTTVAFVNSLGVNVHVEYTDGKYANVTNVINDLRYLGVSNVRDATLNPGNQGQSSYDALAASGVKFDLFMQGTDLSSSFALVDAFIARHPGAILAIEGPNEVNNFPISYQGVGGDQGAVNYQAALYAKVHSDAALSGVKVFNLTTWPDLTGASDDANFHTYPKNGSEPLPQLSADLASQVAKNPDKGVVLTEAGYTTTPGTNYYGSVDELTQAKLTLNLLVDAAKAGVQETFVYELLDAYADPSNSDPEKHFGLFHLDNSPKLAATAIHNLTAILSAPAVANASATPGWALSGLPASGSTLTLAKAAGVSDLVVWAEPQIWDATTNSAIGVASSSVSVHFDAKTDVLVFDPLMGPQATRTLVGIQDLTLDLTDHPLIVEVHASTVVSAAPPLIVVAPAPTLVPVTPPVLVATSATPPVVVALAPAPSPVVTPVLVATPATAPAAPAPSMTTTPAASPTPSSPVITSVSSATSTSLTTTPAVVTADKVSAMGVEIQNLLRLPDGSSSIATGAGDIGSTVSAKSALATQQATADSISASVAAGSLTADQAQKQLYHLVDGTVTVANLSYAYFTGLTPTADGLNYLVNSPSNPADLTDNYYASFNQENRFINFAVTLAKGGVATAWATPDTVAASLSEATQTAYAKIFGVAATADKVAALLNTLVPDGLGGTETRAQYFAGLAGDDLNGVGTKAAVVGWLLASSVSEGEGVYQAAEQNFLSALGHGGAIFNTNLLAAYGSAPSLVGQVALDASLTH